MTTENRVLAEWISCEAMHAVVNVKDIVRLFVFITCRTFTKDAIIMATGRPMTKRVKSAA